jgi:hypothetical protein
MPQARAILHRECGDEAEALDGRGRLEAAWDVSVRVRVVSARTPMRSEGAVRACNQSTDRD